MKRNKTISRRGFLKNSGAATLALLGSRALGMQNDRRIVRAAIHPGIGIARIGNSEEFFIGPEVPDPGPTPAGASRDARGAIKRQAARFRIFGYDAAGRVVAELTARDADIEWRVHLANKKASWYRFHYALDIKDAEGSTFARRNPRVRGDDRTRLVIDPGPRTIAGVERANCPLDGGSFLGVPVSLGELRTDRYGRLLVLSGLGKAGSPTGKPAIDTSSDDAIQESFNNADEWYDDVCDGPVSATVRIDGEEIPVDPAWVAIAPPNYAPDLVGWRTLYELLQETYINSGMMTAPRRTSFMRDVLPALRRLSRLQWVNKGFVSEFRKGGEFDFESPETIARLAGKHEPDFRRRVLSRFRMTDSDPAREKLWPVHYGDAFGSFTDETPRNNLIVPNLVAFHLNRWVNGDFDSDWRADAPPPPRRLSDVPLADRPATLDKAALHFCLADAFHPGCELTWPMRAATIYRAPFRIKRRAASDPERDYGDRLTPEITKAIGGPLHAQGPGDLTRWMAIPWQGDTLFCRSGYEPELDPYLPTFWPARVPNHVLSAADYAIVVDEKQPREERLAAFSRRAHWTRLMRGGPDEQIAQMVREFGLMGIVEARPGVKDDPDLPEIMYVESLPQALPETHESRAFAAAPAPKSAAPYAVAGWESEEQLRQFRRIRLRRDRRE